MKLKYPLAALAFLLALSAASASGVDGVISPNEYSGESVQADGKYRLLWRVTGDTLFMAIDAASPGWVAVGFDPTAVMLNADMVFGLVPASGEVKAIDAWSKGMFGPHPADLDQGGKNSILAFAGKRSGDRVVFEFSRLLNTGDKLDKPIPAKGTLKVIWAYGPGFDFTAKHIQAGSASIAMEAAK